MVVQATMLSALKPPGAEASTGTPNPAAAAASAGPVQPKPVQPAERKAEAKAEDIERTVSDAKGVAEAAGASLEFSIDQDSGKTIVKVVDLTTSEVIRQIPSEELLTLARNMTKLEGLLLDQKA